MPNIKYTPKYVETNFNVTKTSPIVSYLILSTGITLACVVVYILFGAAVSLIAPHLPVSMETKLGVMFESFWDETIDEEETARLQAMLDTLVPLLDQDDRQLDYRVVVNNSPVVNAIALPGGKIIVFSGLLEEISHDRQIAFVLGHELGHFHSRDHLKRMGRGLGGLVLSMVLFGSESQTANFFLQRIQNVESKFSQAQEKAADLFGLKLLQKQYGSGQGALEFMETIARNESKGELAYYFTTHPHPNMRLECLKEEMGQLP